MSIERAELEADTSRRQFEDLERAMIEHNAKFGIVGILAETEEEKLERTLQEADPPCNR